MPIIEGSGSTTTTATTTVGSTNVFKVHDILPQEMYIKKHRLMTTLAGGEKVFFQEIGPSSLGVETHFEYLSKMFRYYSGGFKIHIKIASTAFTGGELIIGYVPNTTSDDLTITMQQLSVYPCKFMEIRNSSAITIDCDYMAVPRLLDMGTPLGVLCCFVSNGMITNSQQQFLDLTIFASPQRNLEYSIISGFSGGAIPTFKQETIDAASILPSLQTTEGIPKSEINGVLHNGAGYAIIDGKMLLKYFMTQADINNICWYPSTNMIGLRHRNIIGVGTALMLLSVPSPAVEIVEGDVLAYTNMVANTRGTVTVEDITPYEGGSGFRRIRFDDAVTNFQHCIITGIQKEIASAKTFIKSHIAKNKRYVVPCAKTNVVAALNTTTTDHSISLFSGNVEELHKNDRVRPQDFLPELLGFAKVGSGIMFDVTVNAIYMLEIVEDLIRPIATNTYIPEDDDPLYLDINARQERILRNKQAFKNF